MMARSSQRQHFANIGKDEHPGLKPGAAISGDVSGGGSPPSAGSQEPDRLNPTQEPAEGGLPPSIPLWIILPRTLVRGANSRIALAIIVLLAVVLACSSAARYPTCERDDQCAVSGKHDYCVSGRCVYCRTTADCADRQRCRAGLCETDPNAPPLVVPDAGDDAEDDAGEGEEAGNEDEGDQKENEAPLRVIPRGVQRFLRP
jgi:hypothetical protein